MSRIDEALRRASVRPTDARGVLSVAPPPQRGALEQFPVERRRVADAELPHADDPRPPAAPPAAQAPAVVRAGRVPVQAVPSDGCRRLASLLAKAGDQRRTSAVMVTCAVEGDGHGAVAIDLAAALSHGGEPVLLIDAGLDGLAMHPRAGVAGPSEPVTDDPLGRPFVRISEYLSVLTAPGTADPHAAERGAERMCALIDECAPMFHWIVLLAPPVSRLPNATVLARRVGAVAFAIGSQTPFAVAQRARAQFDRDLVIGTVLCGMDDHRDSPPPTSD